MKIIECSRDAMQGMPNFISTEDKIRYLNSLLKVGYTAIDCGSIVSPKIIPQMKDTLEVLDAVENNTNTQLSVIVASKNGVEKALQHPNIDILGFPFSISESFQQSNTHSSREKAFELISSIHQDIQGSGKVLLVYFSMAFGNPYGDEWSTNEVVRWTEKFSRLGISQINLSDTIGVATPDTITTLFSQHIESFPDIEFGAHFHTIYSEWRPKIQAAYDAGCERFDTAIQGYGGCPMAKNEMVGNMPTEKVLTFMQEKKLPHNIDILAFESAYNIANDIFG